MHALIYSTSILTAFFGGILALIAPCCIVSLGPTYLAAVMSVPRRHLINRTGIFALGVSSVLLPVVLGIGALGIALNQLHREVFFVGGLLMLAMGVSALAGKGWSLPLPMMRGPSFGRGSLPSMFLLGVFSGVVSSCCAPVLGGVLVLSATAGSLAHALTLGAAYVVGMVFPLFLAALFWNVAHLSERDIFRGRTVPIQLGHVRTHRRIPDLGASILFLGMGSLMVGLAVTNRGTYTPDFLRDFSRWGNDQFGALAMRLAGVPDLVWGMTLAGLIASLVAVSIWAGRRGSARTADSRTHDAATVDRDGTRSCHAHSPAEEHHALTG